MERDNLVVFKGEVDGVLAVLDQTAHFDDVKVSFLNKLKENKDFFAGSKISMRFKGRDLTKKELKDLEQLLAMNNIVDIIFVTHQKPKRKIEKLMETPMPTIEESNEIAKEMEEQEIVEAQKEEKEEKEEREKEKEINLNICSTYYSYGILRSGQEIVHEGSVIVLGDVNPGAVVRATENIIILGNLKGRAFAGQDERYTKKSFVIAYGMHPEQVGIGNFIANSPKEDKNIVKSVTPEIAYLNEDRIYVDEIDFKFIQNMIE